MPESSAEVARRETFTSDQLREIGSFADLAKLINETGVEHVDIADTVLSDGFELLSTTEKDQLVNRPFAIVSWQFAEGDQGEFVTLRCVTKDNRKVIINDGSTGIHEQVRKLHDAGVMPVVFVGKGLRRSDYVRKSEAGIPILDDKGKEQRATTYYLNTGK